jgi:hypothetical protein
MATAVKNSNPTNDILFLLHGIYSGFSGFSSALVVHAGMTQHPKITDDKDFPFLKLSIRVFTWRLNRLTLVTTRSKGGRGNVLLC